jgi:hypothetical protein
MITRRRGSGELNPIEGLGQKLESRARRQIASQRQDRPHLMPVSVRLPFSLLALLIVNGGVCPLLTEGNGSVGIGRKLCIR